MHTVLIANRGEVVRRVARTARAMGLRTVAVYSDADRGAPHANDVDLALPIGGAASADSYLRIDRILEAARIGGADAVHPGYGFLAENAAFARAVIEAGLVWIGPPPDAMDAMADKSEARRRMAARGVPVLPGFDGDDAPRETLRIEAQRIGFPLMVKARAGGGGRGLRLVAQAAQLDAALDAAAAEALAAFGDGRLLLERALVGARHVEVQVVADAHGQAIHLGERDCSVQRRHQKLVEEAPSPAVSPALRRRLGEAAVTVAREVGYAGAGTVEFLMEPDGRFWFMEMNTRLQVEHPVTEALVGIDLVEWQLRLARGEPLPMTQDEALARFERGGHAIEVRLCAEDAAQGDLPQAGRLLRWQPTAGVRCDAALADGLAISPFYDSMLAKLIAHGSTRGDALRRLAMALDGTVCLGLPTNRAMLAAVLRHPVFVAGVATTAFLGTHPEVRDVPADSALEALAAVAQARLPQAALPAAWAGWASTGAVSTASPLQVRGEMRAWQLDGGHARCGNAGHRIEGLRRIDADRIVATVDGRPATAWCVRDGRRSLWLCEGREIETLDLRHGAPAGAAAAAEGALHAPMHGRVTQVLVEAGAAVEAGALLVVMEAMKMEHQLRAPRAGVVSALHARIGDQVAARALLVALA